MSAEPELKWCIAGTTTGAEGPGAHAIDLGREISGEEFERLNYAIRPLETLSGMSAYARTVQLLQTFRQELAEVSDRDRLPPVALFDPPCTVGECRCRGPSPLPNDVLSVAGEFLENEGALEGLRGPVNELEHSKRWRLVIALDEALGDPRRRLIFEDGHLRVRPEPLAVMAAATEVEAEAIPRLAVDELLGAGVLVALKMTAHQLVACREAIRESSLTVRHVAAEVLMGSPALLGFPSGVESTTSLSMTHRALPLAEIQALQQALGRASGLLGSEQADYPERASAQAVSGADVGSTPQEDGLDEDDEQETDRQQEAQEPPAGDGDEGGPGREFGPPPPPVEPQPLDFVALLDHLSRLPAETERAWSKALNADLLGESGQVLRGVGLAARRALPRGERLDRANAGPRDRPGAARAPRGSRSARRLEPGRQRARFLAGAVCGADARSNRRS